MSISQLLQGNSYNLYTNSLNIKNTILDSRGTAYTLVLPNDTDIGPLSILLVDNIIDNKVYLKWSAAINPPQSPFNYIECNTLKANIDVISKSLTFDNINGGSSQFVYNGNDNITYQLPLSLPLQDSLLKTNLNGELEWVNDINAVDVINCNVLNASDSVNTEALEIKNTFQGGSVRFTMTSASDTAYRLPTSLPTTTNDVLRSSVTGDMFWGLSPPNTTRNIIRSNNFASDITYNSNVLYEVVNFDEVLLMNERYRATFNFVCSAGGTQPRRFNISFEIRDLDNGNLSTIIYQPPDQIQLDSSGEYIPISFECIFFTTPFVQELQVYRIKVSLRVTDPGIGYGNTITGRGYLFMVQPF